MVEIKPFFVKLISIFCSCSVINWDEMPPPPFFIKKDAGIESRIADVQSPPSYCYPVPCFLSVFQFIATLGEGGGWAQNKRK